MGLVAVNREGKFASNCYVLAFAETFCWDSGLGSDNA